MALDYDMMWLSDGDFNNFAVRPDEEDGDIVLFQELPFHPHDGLDKVDSIEELREMTDEFYELLDENFEVDEVMNNSRMIRFREANDE